MGPSARTHIFITGAYTSRFIVNLSDLAHIAPAWCGHAGDSALLLDRAAFRLDAASSTTPCACSFIAVPKAQRSVDSEPQYTPYQ